MAGAMRYPTLFCGVFLLAATALASSATRQRQPCRCLPTQWEGVLQSRRRILNMSTGKWQVLEKLWTVHYDYQQKKLAAMLSTDGEGKIMADSKGFTYMLNEAGCHAIPTGVKLERKCEPASPDAVKYFNLANGRAVVRWQHTGPVNTTTRTTVALDNCMPVGQDVYSTQKAEHLNACLHERRVPNWSSNAVSHDNAQLCAFRRATRLDTATKILTRATLELSFDGRTFCRSLI
ncbi:hypothetical protein LSAT2_009184, partial [Lamellibrachia satsuma]